jgi:hypothetical protein
MSKDSHVNKRDGHLGLGGPRPPVAERSSKGPAEADTGLASFPSSYSDPSTVGHYDERKAFEAAHGNPSPRQRLERGEQVDGKVDRVAPGGIHQKPGDASIAGAAPLT